MPRMASALRLGLAGFAFLAVAQSATLNEVCKPVYVQSHLPSNDVCPGITILSPVLANPLLNASESGSVN